MRVATRTIYQNINTNISRITEQLKVVNEQISSSKRINRPSDDPIGITHTLNLKEILAQIGQYETNIKHGQSWLQSSESAVQSVEDLTVRAKEVANQMATGTYTASDRQNSAKEVQNILQQLVQLGNTQVNGRYIFSGDKDKTAAYSLDLSIHDAVAASTNNPAYTGTATSSGTYTGLYSKDYVVQITTPGAVGTAKYKVSEDGGTTWSDDNAFTTTASTAGSGVYAGATTSVTKPGWTGTSEPSSSGNDFAGTSSAQYTFRVPTVILDGSNLLPATVTWTKTGGGIGSFDIPANYDGTALDVEDGLTVSFETGAGETLVDGNTFTVDVTPSDSLETPPNQGAKIAFTNSGTLTMGDRFTVEVSRYNGDSDRQNILIGQSAQIQVNLTGNEVFGGPGDTENNFLDIVAGLKNALENNNIDGVQAALA
ncbi:MAG: flagellar hook-associated protein FlgL, partial [Deltaproteobacteria bacterium]|nr:flagellar hook-associated protein FlgL [Deltaproteobacteria bacterium]